LKKLSSLLVLCALVLGACGAGSNEVAATVDGTEITVGDVEALVDKPKDEEMAKDEFANFLSFNIVLDIFTRGAETDFDITFTDEEIATEADSIITSELEQGQTREEFLAVNEVTEQLLLQVAHQTLIQGAILEQMQSEVTEPTQEEIDAFFQEASLMVCSSHILVATEAEAQDVEDRLAAGEDFATVAQEVSTDGSADSGGDLGCSDPAQYVPEFAEAVQSAEVGVPTDPVETEFGFHVILLREDELPTEEQAIASLKDQAAQLASQTWFLDAAGAAEVEVNEKFGTWQSEPTPEVIPPVDETSSTTSATTN
jgi:parvulin-like peptidyl-prolyl isomerase